MWNLAAEINEAHHLCNELRRLMKAMKRSERTRRRQVLQLGASLARANQKIVGLRSASARARAAG